MIANARTLCRKFPPPICRLNTRWPTRLRYALVALLLVLAACDKAPTPNVLTMEGLGPVRFGMTASEMESALGGKFAPMDPRENTGCWYTHRTDAPEPGVLYMMSDGKLVRIDIRPLESGMPSNIASDKGVRIDTPEPTVRAAYGAALTAGPHKYLPGAVYLRVADAGNAHATVFESVNGKITTFRSGVVPQVDQVEGCS